VKAVLRIKYGANLQLLFEMCKFFWHDVCLLLSEPVSKSSVKCLNGGQDYETIIGFSAWRDARVERKCARCKESTA